MDAAETAVAHHRDVIAVLCGFHHHFRQRIDISTPVSRPVRRLRRLPPLRRLNMRRPQQEHFIRHALTTASVILHNPIHRKAERGSAPRYRARCRPLAAQRRQRAQNCRRMVSKIVIHRHAVRFTACSSSIYGGVNK